MVGFSCNHSLQTISHFLVAPPFLVVYFPIYMFVLPNMINFKGKSAIKINVLHDFIMIIKFGWHKECEGSTFHSIHVI